MKYLFISLAAIILATVAFKEGISLANDQAEETPSPCSIESIVKAKNPDARLSHCRDHDWDGSTLLKKRLAEARNHPTEYGILLQDDQIRYALLPSVIQPEAPEVVRMAQLPESATAQK